MDGWATFWTASSCSETDIKRYKDIIEEALAKGSLSLGSANGENKGKRRKPDSGDDYPWTDKAIAKRQKREAREAKEAEKEAAKMGVDTSTGSTSKGKGEHPDAALVALIQKRNAAGPFSGSFLDDLESKYAT